MKRESLDNDDEQKPKPISPGGRYFAVPRTLNMITTGCTLLDCVLGGGVPEGRMSNIVGDWSAGKTQLSVEIAANYHLLHPKRRIYYNETESAFDKGYAEVLGLPLDAITFVADKKEIDTVEDFTDDFERVCARGKPALYILDSLDGLPSRADVDHRAKQLAARAAGKEEKGSYGTGKAKEMHRLFRHAVRLAERNNVTLIIVNQLKDKIGSTVMMGETKTRSGGKALDYFSSWVIWLQKLKKIEQTRKGVSRKIGVNIKCVCKRNKVTLPFRECSFPIKFAFGIDDVTAGLNWLVEIKRKDLVEQLTDGVDPDTLDNAAYAKLRVKVSETVKREWREIELRFLPRRSKYGNA